jgi:Spy/CpxP family protein refolding chaperone
MSRSLAWVLGALLACGVPAAAAPLDCAYDQSTGQKPDQTRAGQPDSHPRPDPWWKAATSRTELGISDQQSKDIDDIFQATRPSLKAGKDELDKLDDAVSRMIKEGTADIAAVNRQVVQLEQARAKLNQTRTMMLYRMHRVLSPEQRVKLNAMFERWDAERRKSNPPKDRR